MATDKPRLVALPEFFNTPVVPNLFKKVAEQVPGGDTSVLMSSISKELGIYLVAGSMVEVRDNNKLYNTCAVWNPAGDLVTKFSKLHAFDVDLPGIQVRESEFFTSGDRLVSFDVDGFRIGLGICYDLRFDEMAKLYRLGEGCNVLMFLGAFNMITGPMHWELLNRSRAVDTQCYVASISRSTRPEDSYVAYGHSMCVDPFGKIVVAAQHDEATLIADLGESLLIVEPGERVDLIDPWFQFQT